MVGGELRGRLVRVKVNSRPQPGVPFSGLAVRGCACKRFCWRVDQRRRWFCRGGFGWVCVMNGGVVGCDRCKVHEREKTSHAVYRYSYISLHTEPPTGSATQMFCLVGRQHVCGDNLSRYELGGRKRTRREAACVVVVGGGCTLQDLGGP